MIFLLWVTVLDISSDRIPNLLLAGIFLLRIVLTVCLYDAGSSVSGYLLESIFYSIIPVLVLYPFFKIGTIGAGDIKLMAICSIGIKTPIVFLLLIFLFGSFLSLYKMIRNKNLIMRFSYFKNYLFECVRTGTVSPYFPDLNEQKNKKIIVHMSVAVLFSVIATALFFHNF